MKRLFLLWMVLGLFVTLFPSNTVVATDVPHHYGFIKSKNGALPSIDNEAFKGILKENGAIFLGDTTKKEIYLTFDNGYENGYTVKVLDILKEKKIPAAFFVTGHYAKDQPELLKRMANEGHIVGNHSWGHPDMSQISNSRVTDELEKLKNQVLETTGQKEMRFMRPPQGIFSKRMLEVSKELGYTNVFWSIAYKDWDTKDQKGSKYAYDHVMKQLHPGAVILLHSVSKDNADALRQIIDDTLKQGYEFKSLDQLTTKNY
ncbi:polysaccharide deacetylase [Paenibacillus sp. IHBB 10380]|nr:polysaccharide deacetylase [Paenibacillus sp. IHBB 10380]